MDEFMTCVVQNTSSKILRWHTSSQHHHNIIAVWEDANRCCLFVNKKDGGVAVADGQRPEIPKVKFNRLCCRLTQRVATPSKSTVKDETLYVIRASAVYWSHREILHFLLMVRTYGYYYPAMKTFLLGWIVVGSERNSDHTVIISITNSSVITIVMA